MDEQYIASRIEFFLHEVTATLSDWLNSILPRVTENWWDDCVLNSLSYTQKITASSKGYSKLSDFDLAALLRIANKSWYDIQTVTYLSTSVRETIRAMINVRNNWSHCGELLPGKDSIINDLHTISDLIAQLNGDVEICSDIDSFISEIEKPDSIQSNFDEVQKRRERIRLLQNSNYDESTTEEQIKENSFVYLVGDPEKKGVVYKITDLGAVTKYDVFVDGALRTYYTGQIAAAAAEQEYEWVDKEEAKCCLTAYQINNPSSQNLYSLNSARIDFVPYQFRPALKMIHADEPRILIADSVGVGKTIEAGLIIKELEARKELESVVVICPRPLVAERKWEIEMKRFDEEFIPLDGLMLRQIISDTDRDGVWPSRYNKVIIPYSILDSRTYHGDGYKRSRSFGLSELDPEPHFDLVIVDEAHHIRNGSMEKEKAFAYKCTKYFCDHADAVVMLTATPLQTGNSDLFTLLNVLRPDIVMDPNTFIMMCRPNEFISRAAHCARIAGEGWVDKTVKELLNVRKTQWGDNVIADNPLFDDILFRLEKENISREDRVQIIYDIESLNSFSSMINRTRRRDIQDFCVRRSHTISTEFTQYQKELHDELLNFEYNALSALHDSKSIEFMMSTIKRQAASCIFGLASQIREIINRRIQQMNEDLDYEYAGYSIDDKSTNMISAMAKKVLYLSDNLPDEDPKFEKVLEIIREKYKQNNNKIMLFSTFRHTLAYLKKKLTGLKFRVGQIDGSVNDEQRYELKSRFELPKEDKNAIDILLFTEVGSEGLDYQFCNLMINYDLPWNPMRIEQRIGRIDRRGQMSEVVNIYNIITENTVDADIYYRCLVRIGIFESSIGECEEILGDIAKGIEDIVFDNRLTESERRIKLEQIADNEVRKIQELSRLEEEEKELFGFNISEFSTAQEIRKAENPWLTQSSLQTLIEKYFQERIGKGSYIIGESAMKNLRLSATARGLVREDLRKLHGGRNAVRRLWESYLSGRQPNHALTFDSDAASRNRDSFFITPMHPLAKQAAEYYSRNKTNYLNLLYYSDVISEGVYLFSVYAWTYTGFNTSNKIVVVCENEHICADFPDILDASESLTEKISARYDWSALEASQVNMWMKARDAHKKETRTMIDYKLESLANNQGNHIRILHQQISDAFNESIRRMRVGELETVQTNYELKIQEVNQMAVKADIYTTCLINGIITVIKE